MIKHFCDRCGNDLEHCEWSHIKVDDGREYDLCNECNLYFYDFMKGRSVIQVAEQPNANPYRD